MINDAVYSVPLSNLASNQAIEVSDDRYVAHLDGLNSTIGAFVAAVGNVVQFSLEGTAGDSIQRSELSGAYTQTGDTIWNAYSFMATDFSIPVDGWAVVGQFHGGADDGRSPYLALELRGSDLVVVGRGYDPSGPKGMGTQQVFGTVKDFDRGQWHDVVIEHQVDQIAGFVKVWIDGQLVADYTGPLGYWDQALGGYWKYGIYRSGEVFEASVYYANMEYGTSELSSLISQPNQPHFLTVEALYSAQSATLEGTAYTKLYLSGSGDIAGTGNDLDNTISGTTGSNILDGRGGSDQLYGGLGNDTYILGSGDDTVVEAGGIDTTTTEITRSLEAFSGIENLVLVGTANINGFGNQFANRLVGNDRDNVLDGGGGSDVLIGGKGNDTYNLAAGFDTVIDNSGNDTITSTIDRSLASYSGIENMVLTGGDNIRGTGNSLDNLMVGNSGNNVLDGSGGHDVIRGGLGNDVYLLGSEFDVVIDIGGNDTIVSTIFRNLSAYVGIENLSLAGAQHLNAIGNAYDNVLVGNSGNNVLDGAGGHDQLYGGGGNDIYRLGAGYDSVIDTSGIDCILSEINRSLQGYGDIEHLILQGSAVVGTGNSLANGIVGSGANNILAGLAGNDTLYGEAGDDFLFGQGGRDTLKGGAGNDTFAYQVSSDAMPGKLSDIILDFDDNGNDRIDLSRVFSGSLQYMGAGNFTGLNQVRINDVAGPHLVVEVNISGDARPEMQIFLQATTLPAMGIDDFLL